MCYLLRVNLLGKFHLCFLDASYVYPIEAWWEQNYLNNTVVYHINIYCLFAD